MYTSANRSFLSAFSLIKISSKPSISAVSPLPVRFFKNGISKPCKPPFCGGGGGGGGVFARSSCSAFSCRGTTLQTAAREAYSPAPVLFDGSGVHFAHTLHRRLLLFHKIVFAHNFHPNTKITVRFPL